MRQFTAVTLFVITFCVAATFAQQKKTSFQDKTSGFFVVSVEQDGTGDALDLRVPGKGNLLINGFLSAPGSEGRQTLFTVDGVGHGSFRSSVNTGLGYEIGGKTVLSIGSGGPGDGNTFTGVDAGTANIPGNGRFNTFFGNAAGENNSTGLANTFFGSAAGENNSTGLANTLIGPFAGQFNTTGSENVMVGESAGETNRTGSRNIYIGSLGNLACQENDTIRIGLDGNNKDCAPGKPPGTYIGNIVSDNVRGVPVLISQSGQLGIASSSRRFKEQIHDMGESTNALVKLRPVTFLYKPEYANGDRSLQYGLLAEEVASVYPELVANDEDGQPYSVRYQYLTSMLLNEVQKQYRRAQSEAEVIKAQEQKIEQLEDRLSRVEGLVRAQVQTIAAGRD